MKAVEGNIPALNTAAICERLKQVRVQVCGPRGQSHFAALLNLSPSTYNYYEKGRIPPVDVLDRAARVTGAPLLWLIRGEPGDFGLESLKKIEPPPVAASPEGSAPAATPPATGPAA
jgi:transcriptional regulator with XRE-family HTH domain